MNNQTETPYTQIENKFKYSETVQKKIKLEFTAKIQGLLIFHFQYRQTFRLLNYKHQEINQ